MSVFQEFFGKEIEYSGVNRHIVIEETSLPMRKMENIDLRTGDTVVLEVEIMINEPTIDGFRGVVHTVRSKGYKVTSDFKSVEEEE